MQMTILKIMNFSTLSVLEFSLEAGWHKLHLELDGDRRKYLKMMLAGEHVAVLLDGDNIGH